MKKILIGLAVFCALVVAILVAAPAFIPVDAYKRQIEAAGLDATGRALKVNGDFRLSLLPRFELKAEDVTLANPPGSSAPHLGSLESLLVRLEILPLLSGKVKVDSFVLVAPQIDLEVDAKGRPNWTFEGKADAKPSNIEPVPDTTREGGTGAGVADISLGDVRIEAGRLSYRDARTGVAHEISDIDMDISLADLASPLEARGSLDWNGETVALTVGVESPRAIIEGDGTRVEADIESPRVALSSVGQVAAKEKFRFDGNVALDVPSIRELAAWTGNPLELPGDGLGPFRIAGTLSASPDRFAFTDADIGLDGMTGSGLLVVETGGKVPYLKGEIDLDRLDLNKYLPPAGGSDGKAQPKTTEAADGPKDWSDDPIDVAPLKALNADFQLSLGEIHVQAMRIGRSALRLAMQDGLLTADLAELSLYQGSGRGRLVVDGRGAIPAVEKSFAIAGVESAGLLTDAAAFDGLEGTGTLELSIKTKGKTQRAMVKALNGKGSVRFVDGAIKGINLAAMVRNISSAFLDQAAGRAQKTDFAELSGSFTITNGILKNGDMKLLSPLLRLSGAGEVDMPERTMNYRFEPNFVASLEGQGGTEALKGLMVPVIVEGPWDNLTYRPDLAAALTGIAKDREGAKGGLGEILKGLQGQTDGDGESGQAPNPVDTLRNLFGN